MANICRMCNLFDNAAKCWLQIHLTGFILVLKGSGHEHCWLLFCLVIILLCVTTVVCRSPSKLPVLVANLCTILLAAS